MKAKTLYEARSQRGLTQKELEAASGVEQSIISRLERGSNVNPSFETVRKLEAALRLRPGTLVFGEHAQTEQAS